MHILVRQLEITLGPDTADLGLRFGLHSGPVTAGVLRGERARFQLFGDTMNTTARIETTGAKNKIHLSQETAELIRQAGKGHWVRAREDKVHAKGKGELSTFWLEIKEGKASATSSDSGNDITVDSNFESARTEFVAARSEETHLLHDAEGAEKHSEASPCDDANMQIVPEGKSDKAERLVNWNTEIICRILREIIARREAIGTPPDTEEELLNLERSSVLRHEGRIVMDERVDVIELPIFCAASKKQRDSESIKLVPMVVNQLHDYIQTVAALYRDNPFHNFEHASHVTMSVTKLLSRIAAPDIDVLGNTDYESDKELHHDQAYSITLSPMTQLAIVLSALIHDVDHTGVPNSQLIQEQSSIAAAYRNKSVAEQNSIDIAWELLMQEPYKELRRTVYQTKEEFQRFRQLLVNAVLATDIIDKDLNAQRKERWNRAFAAKEDNIVNSNEVATIVIEYLIQASDVVHTMQHWHIYRKWNEHLFLEQYKAYKEGRAERDPSETWYEGEIGFFDFYVLPLATTLKDCGAFGVSSDEYMSYARQNRCEWEMKGLEVVSEMKKRALLRFP